ncbi:hypothetical protein COU76_00350, partial [Candidatus Peregrinibacteria bacterium CG10_big_fil_rev_8_21_14_0_10_49_10]
MAITAGGNIGIGTTTPDRKLVVSGGTSGTNTSIFAIQNSGGSAANSGASIEFSGKNGSSIFKDMARIGTLLQNGSNGAEVTDLAFSTIGSGTLDERMRITGGGNVGIGTTNPGYKLDVVGTGRITGNTFIDGRLSLNIDGADGLLMGQDGANNQSNRIFFETASGSGVIMGTANGGLSLRTGGTIGSSSGTERLLITSNGNVGIGTASPTALLQVVGTTTLATSGGNVGIGTTGPETKFHLAETTAGSAVVSAIKHTDNTAGQQSDAYQLISVGGGTTPGDAYTRWNVLSATNWTAGIDNSDSDKWKLDAGATPGSATKLTVDTSGNVGIGTT